MRRNAIIDDYKKEYEALLKENEGTGNEEEFDEKELIAFRKFAKRLKDFDTKHEKLKKMAIL